MAGKSGCPGGSIRVTIEFVNVVASNRCGVWMWTLAACLAAGKLTDTAARCRPLLVDLSSWKAAPQNTAPTNMAAVAVALSPIM